MANWSKFILTEKGKEMQAKADAGTILTFSKVGVGAGTGDPVSTITELYDKRIDLTIGSVKASGNKAEITTTLTNDGLSNAFHESEIGVYVKNEAGDDVLFAFAQDSDPDLIPAEGGSTMISKAITIHLIFSDAESVSASLDTSQFVTQSAFDDAVKTLSGTTSSEIAKLPKMSEIINTIYPVGSIYLAMGSLNPNTQWTGTKWERFGQGRTFVGAGDFTEDNTAYTYKNGDIGGEAKHILTLEESPEHNHIAAVSIEGAHIHEGVTDGAGNHNHSGTTNTSGEHTHNIPGYKNESRDGPGLAGGGAEVTATATTTSNGGHTHSFSTNTTGAHTHTLTTDSQGAHTHVVTIGNAGGGEAHENRMPYIVVTFWKRTA